jgi:hypothetical protein
MVNIDLSKAFPHRAFAYAVALLPGLFFEIVVLAGAPNIVTRIDFSPGNLAKLSPYLEIVVVLVFAFIIGNLALDTVSLIQISLGYLHRSKGDAKRAVFRKIFLRLSNRMMKRESWRNRPVAAKIHRFCSQQCYEDFGFTDRVARGHQCWRELSRKLLKDKYDVNIDEMQWTWDFLYWNLGEITIGERRGDLLVMATHAIGWCGLVAAWVAPQLRNRYFISFCCLSLLIGLFHDYYVASRLNNGEALAHARIRALLRQYDLPKKGAA